jgi:hypothetical protein
MSAAMREQIAEMAEDKAEEIVELTPVMGEELI